MDNPDYVEMLHCLRAYYFSNATEQYTQEQITRGAMLYRQGFTLKRRRDNEAGDIATLKVESLAEITDQLEEGHPLKLSTFHYFLLAPTAMMRRSLAQ